MPYDLFAALRGPIHVGGVRFTFRVPTILVGGLDRGAAASKLASAVAGQVASELEFGRAPDGQPLPARRPSTIARRRYRSAQVGRGGEAAPRYRSTAFRARVLADFDKRFEGSDLAHAVQVVPNGVGFRIIVVGQLAVIDRDGRSGIERLLRDGWGRGVMSMPRVGEAMAAIAASLFRRR